MLDITNSTSETYETTIDNTTFQVIARYIGEKTFLGVIKTAIKRDIEIVKNEEEK
ncbi:MAG: hypothetical protein LBH79_04455 [Nitrososphaerota archaeon]|jgi:hypothetical protein|nr:hypothetical protein [Nitrososphaerota archaeon]